MKLILFIVLMMALGYGFYWTFLSKGYGLLKPYLGYDNYAELKSQAWLWFVIVLCVFVFGIGKAMTETQVYRVTFMPSLTLGYVVGHLHLLRIPRERWQR